MNKFKYYTIYDSCYKGYRYNDKDGYPVGSIIFTTLDKNKAKRIVDVMTPIAEKENKFPPTMRKNIFNYEEANVDIENMTDEEIVKWIKE